MLFLKSFLQKSKKIIFYLIIFSLFAPPLQTLGITAEELKLIKITPEEAGEIVLKNGAEKIISSRMIWLEKKPFYVIEGEQIAKKNSDLEIKNLVQSTVNAASGEFNESARWRIIKIKGQEIMEKPQELLVLDEAGNIMSLYNLSPDFKKLVREKIITDEIKTLVAFSVVNELRKPRIPKLIHKIIVQVKKECGNNFFKKTKILSKIYTNENYNFFTIKTTLPNLRKLMDNECAVKFIGQEGLNNFAAVNPDIPQEKMLQSFTEKKFTLWKDRIFNKFWLIIYQLQNWRRR